LTFYETIIIVFTLNKEIIEERNRGVDSIFFNKQVHADDLLHEPALNAMREIGKISYWGKRLN